MVMTTLYMAVMYAAAWSALSFWKVIKRASSGSPFTPGKAGAGPRPRNGVQGELKWTTPCLGSPGASSSGTSMCVCVYCVCVCVCVWRLN